MSELISVVVPVYKVEKYLERCIKSIVGQSYRNIEIILVDDGSPDSCPAICDQWGEIDTRIKVIHKSNGGLSDARNAGIQVARGEYIAFIDSDDYIHPQFIEILYLVMKQEHAEVVACGHKKVNSVQVYEMPEIDIQDIDVKNVEEITTISIGVMAWNKLYRRAIFDKIQFPKGKIYEDVGIFWKMVYYASNIVAISNELYYYCENPTSITRTDFTMVHMDLVDGLYAQYMEFQQMSEDVYASKILMACLNAYPGLYIGLKQGKSFSRKDKEKFLIDYRSKAIECLRNSHIAFSFKIKHLIYSNIPAMLICIWKSRHK